MAEDQKTLEEIVLTRVVRLNAKAQGIVTGLMVGAGIFIATNWLILKGGYIGPLGEPVLGPHLSLLGQFFIGYSVTFVGSLIGFAYAFVFGFVGGYFFSRLYNSIAGHREDRRQRHA